MVEICVISGGRTTLPSHGITRIGIQPEMSIYQHRINQVRQAMIERGIELLVLSPSPYMFWTIGVRDQPWFGSLKGPGDWLGGVFISPDVGPIFVVHWMVHRILMRQPGALDEVVQETIVVQNDDDPLAVLKQVLGKFKLQHPRVAVADRTWAVYTEALRAALPGIQLSLGSEIMDPLVAIKDEQALTLMRHAAAINDRAYGEVLKFLRAGVTEADVALEVDYQFRKAGAEGNSFRSTVVFGGPDPNAPMPNRRLQPGDSVMFDIGCVAEGYCSDFGRNAFLGDPPKEYLELHELNLLAQREGMNALKAGQITCGEIVPIVQNVWRAHGYGANFIPQVGHAIGMTVHEPPFFIEGDRTIVQAGMTFTIEPTIRGPGRFSNRVEDIVLVTPQGTEYITQFPRELYIIQ